MICYLVFCVSVLFGQGWSYGVHRRHYHNREIPGGDLREIGDNLPNLLFQTLKSYDYNNGVNTQNKLQPNHHHAPFYGNHQRSGNANNNNNDYEIYQLNFDNNNNNIRGQNYPHPGPGSFENGKYDVIGPFPIDFGPGFQHSPEYHRKIGDEKFFAKSEKPPTEYAVIEIHEQPDLPNPNVRYTPVIATTRQPRLDELTPTQSSVTITASTELNVRDPYPCLDVRSKSGFNSPGFQSAGADCLGLPRGRPRRPPRPSTTVAPASIDPRASSASFISTPPSIDIRAKVPSDRDSIVFPED